MTNVPDPQQFYARMSDVAYKPLNKRQAYLTEHFTGRYRIVPKFSSKTFALIEDTQTGNLTASFRGTSVHDLSDLEDIGTDALIAFGLEKSSTRFKRDLETVENIQNSDEFKGREITLAGHSLGGSTARNVARELNLPAYVFNPGSGIGQVTSLRPDQIAGGRFNKREGHDSTKINTFITGRDPISGLSRSVPIHATLSGDHFEQLHIVHVDEKTENPHSLTHFLGLDEHSLSTFFDEKDPELPDAPVREPVEEKAPLDVRTVNLIKDQPNDQQQTPMQQTEEEQGT